MYLHVWIPSNTSVSLPCQSQLQPAQYYATPAVTRYFDHIQSLPSVRAAAQALSPAFSTVPLDFGSAPKIERKQEPPKKKEKTPKAVDQSEAGKKKEITTSSKQGGGEPPKEKKEKKEKKKDAVAAEDGGKKGKGGAGGGAAPAEDAGEPTPSMIDLRVGHIVDGMISSNSLLVLTVLLSVKKHPDADSLYIEVRPVESRFQGLSETLSSQQIDLGEETGPRTVVSGLVNYIPIEEMRDKYLVAIVRGRHF